MYTTIIHPLRKALKLSLTEYCVLESIRSLSHNNEYGGWCVASKQKIADGLDITRRQVHNILKKLVEIGFVEKGEGGAMRTVDDYNRIFDIEDLQITDFDSLISSIPKNFLNKNENFNQTDNVKKFHNMDDFDTQCEKISHESEKKFHTDSEKISHNTNNILNIDTLKKDKQKKKSIESNHKKSKTQIAKDFYKKQMETLNENFSGKVAILYPEFVDFLFGKNDLEHELNGVLSMEDQITVSQFNKLLEVAKKFNRTIKDSVMGIENGGYYKKKKSFYLTLRKWLSNTKYTQ